MPAGAVDERHVEAVLQRHAIARPDDVEEAEGLVVGASEDVLAVVDAKPGLAILERRGPAAEASTGFEHQHAAPGVGEAHRGGKAGEAGADDDDVVGHAGYIGPPKRRLTSRETSAKASLTRNVMRVQIVMAIQARRGRDTRIVSPNTSKSRRSISARIAW